MKKPNILLIQHSRPHCEFNLSRLRPVLELISCQVEICAGGDTRQLLPFLAKKTPDLVIVDRPLLSARSFLSKQPQLHRGTLGCPQIVLSEEKDLLRAPGQTAPGMGIPVDVIALHGRIGQSLGNYPRKHLRMPAHLPCVFTSRGFSHFGEILSLGTGGAFIKTPCQQLRPGDMVDVGIPLLGMKRELEIRSRLAYLLLPKAENNYRQGFGVEFVAPDRETAGVLEDFLRLSLLDEIDPVFPGFGLSWPQSEPPPESAVSHAEAIPQLQLRG